MAIYNLPDSPHNYYGDYPNQYNHYQFISLEDVIKQFMVAYVGQDKIISKIRKTDVAFHAQRALQEFSFDTFKSCKSHEITVPASLKIVLPQDYINYTKVSWVDSSGIKHLLYPNSKTSNPSKFQADDDGNYLFGYGVGSELIPSGDLLRSGNFHGYILDDWLLNQELLDTTQSVTDYSSLTVVNTSDPTLVYPQQGWFHGYDGSAVRAYDCPKGWGMLQRRLPIMAGESYTITYTISSFTQGTIKFVLTDRRGDSAEFEHLLSAGNGTFSKTVVAGETATAHYAPQALNIKSSHATDNLNVILESVSVVRVGNEETSTTWSNYKSSTPSENNNDDYEDDTYWPAEGRRYGLDPQHSQVNGSFFIDCNLGNIHFSSNISGKTVILDYISDSLGTTEELKVHKFAEEAMYKWIAYAILSTRSNTPEYQIARFKKERFAETRKAKLRLSNIKLEEITQILRGKSKIIKH